MPAIPEIIDVRDDLNRARSAADAELSDEVDEIRDLLADFVTETDRDREGILDDIDNSLLRLEEQVADDAASEHLQAARNRIELFRDAFTDADADLVITRLRVRPDSPADGEGTDITAYRGERIDLEVTIANVGGPATGRPVLAFYDDENAEVGTVTGDPVEFSDGEQRTIGLDVAVPSDATQYSASVETSEGD